MRTAIWADQDAIWHIDSETEIRTKDDQGKTKDYGEFQERLAGATVGDMEKVSGTIRSRSEHVRLGTIEQHVKSARDRAYKKVRSKADAARKTADSEPIIPDEPRFAAAWSSVNIRKNIDQYRGVVIQVNKGEMIWTDQ